MGMNGYWAISVLVSILILGTLVTGLTANAYAAPTLTIDQAEMNLKNSRLVIESTVSGFTTIDLDAFQVAYILKNNVNGELAFGFCFFIDQGTDLKCVSYEGVNTLETKKISLKPDIGKLRIVAVVTGFSTLNPGELEVLVFLENSPNQEHAMSTAPLKITQTANT